MFDEHFTMRISGPFNTSARIKRDKKPGEAIMKIVDELKSRKERGLGLDKSLYMSRRYNR